MKLSYDGTGFKGFARQSTHRTVQGVLEERLSLLLREEILTVGAGRTDTGVHAAGQVVSFDVTKAPDCDQIIKRINKVCGPEIMLQHAVIVEDSFSARFSATRREYLYRFYSGAGRDPFRDRFAVWTDESLDAKRMDEAASALIGEHDFSAFCRANDRSMVRRLRTADVKRKADEIHIRVIADSFCHQMVRSIAGCLYDVGRAKREPKWLVTVIESRDRRNASDVAPPRGLTLVKVSYSPDPFAR
ncbi:MAG: tRNA pseudouridine(38-40) synthase TruA [Actinomycetota bacterium]